MKLKNDAELVGSPKSERNVTLELDNLLESSLPERPRTTLTWHSLQVYLPTAENQFFSKAKGAEGSNGKHIIKNSKFSHRFRYIN